MARSLEQVLDEVARRGSWMGGGSAAALSAALAAALLEKLTFQSREARALREVRRACLRLIDQDAKTFARAIEALQFRRVGTFRRWLKVATSVQEDVHQHAKMIQRVSRQAMGRVKPQFRSDLQCAIALAVAAQRSSQVLIRTNRAWLNHHRAALRVGTTPASRRQPLRRRS